MRPIHRITHSTRWLLATAALGLTSCVGPSDPPDAARAEVNISGVTTTPAAQDPTPTAVFCGNDILAIGALFEAQAQGLAVPETLSIIGYDDLELAAQVTPPLTTVHVPTGEMGARAAEILLMMLAGQAAPHATRIETNLIIRGTTGPAPTQA